MLHLRTDGSPLASLFLLLSHQVAATEYRQYVLVNEQ
jgi:hypothetical protein